MKTIAIVIALLSLSGCADEWQKAKDTRQSNGIDNQIKETDGQ